MTITYNAQSLTVPPRLEQMMLLLLIHQEMISSLPTCSVELLCGHGLEVKGKLRVDLHREKVLDNT